MTKSYARGLSALFCVCLMGTTALSVAMPDQNRSDVENRTLAQWPSLSWTAVKDGSFMEGVDAYFTDQFPFRDSWTGLHARLELLMGKTELGDVFVCDDETLIAKVPQPDQTLVDKNLAAVAALTGKTDIPVSLALIPSAAEIWKDFLPTGTENYAQTDLIAQAEEFSMADIYTALSSNADQDIFYRTDHHWTTLGAYYGYQAILESMNMTPLQQSDFTITTLSDDFNGTLYSNSGVHWFTPDSMESWVTDDGLIITSWRTGTEMEGVLYDTNYLTQKDKYSTYLGGNQPLCVIKNENLPEGRKLLLVRDSYSDALAPLLSQSFGEVHLLDLRYYRASVAQYATANDIDQIVICYSIPNFITDVNLALLYQ
ncbi:DHHW family protein [Bengtsoniella intestinalis]|uniref:DHHW family protein n=1 Tax=Bengtsoniella intestinalis TaxID=3073143 RepID=UPI00391FB26F